MDERKIQKIIGYLAVVIVAYHIVSFFVDYLVWVVIGLMAWRSVQEYHKSKK
jgi:hypothetical protein